jgi:CMP-N-acetylneuraminic acid synthetase
LNYRLDQPTPRTQDLAPVLMEQSGLYVFTRELFESTGARVGPDPYIQLVDAVEGHDIDTEVEFDVAEALLSLR